MYTGVYYPRDYTNVRYHWTEGDVTHIAHGFAPLEPPSYSVFLLVFEMPED